jgi:hypothetical protein
VVVYVVPGIHGFHWAARVGADDEDLYFATREAQHVQLAAVWSFLGLPPLNTPDVDYYLDPQTAKLGGLKTYGRLPNAAEIDAVLGADETGWLFPLVP